MDIWNSSLFNNPLWDRVDTMMDESPFWQKAEKAWGVDKIDKEEKEKEKEQARQQAIWDRGWEIAGSDFSAQDMFHDMSLGAFNTDPMPMRDKYDPWSLG